MPNKKEAEIKAMDLSPLELLPDLAWQEIGHYLDQSTRYPIQRISKTIKARIEKNCLGNSIRLEKAAQYHKFIQEKHSYQSQIRNLYLSGEVTDAIFPFPKNYNPASLFSFFALIRKHFPRIQNIYLELQHFYMVSMIIQDPEFQNEVSLIKELSTKPFPLSVEGSFLSPEAKKEIKEKYEPSFSQANYKTFLRVDYMNIFLTREELSKLGKFTSLERLHISLSGGHFCDYEDIDHLLHALPKLKSLEIETSHWLTNDPPENGTIWAEGIKEYSISERDLKNYPNITSLSLKGDYFPERLLGHFPQLKNLVLDFSHFAFWNSGLPNKLIDLLAQLPYPEKLLSLEIPSSISVSIDGIKYKCVNNVAQLTQYTNLEKLIITCGKDPNNYSIAIGSPSSPLSKQVAYENKDYTFPSVTCLEIHYDSHHSYHAGDIKRIRALFPKLKNLTIINHDSIKPETPWKFINELEEVLKENPWKNSKIDIHGLDTCPNLKFPNFTFRDKKLTISTNNYSLIAQANYSNSHLFRVKNDGKSDDTSREKNYYSARRASF